MWAVSAPARRSDRPAAVAAGAAGSVEVVVTERNAWDRREGETAKAYGAFRHYRDQGVLREVERVPLASRSQCYRWAQRWDWGSRATAWDDASHMLDDRQRLEAIRTMHDTHQRAGRAAIGKAIAALQHLQPEQIPATAAAQLLELGARLERTTLIVSVEELQGIADRHRCRRTRGSGSPVSSKAPPASPPVPALRHATAPTARPTRGGLMASVGELLGWKLFPWQAYAAAVAMEYDRRTKVPVYRTVGVSRGPPERQDGADAGAASPCS